MALLIWFIAPAQQNKITESKPLTLAERFMLFDELSSQSVYSITIAADVPDNKRPMKVYYKKEPGHVFIILEKKDTVTGNAVSQSWGFYPVRPISSLFVRTVKCELRNNGSREYDAAIKKFISKEEFELIRSKAIALSAKKYNLNRYNCYNYALDLYNALPAVAAIPVEKIRFPFVFGKGGSPCILYKYLKGRILRHQKKTVSVFISEVIKHLQTGSLQMPFMQEQKKIH